VIPYAPVRIDYPHHPKVLRAGLEAAVLNVGALCYANRYRTDGFIPLEAVESLWPGLKDTERLAERLVEVGMWEQVDGGFMIHDFLEMNYSAERVKKIQDQRRHAGQKGGAARAAAAERIGGRFTSQPSRQASGDVAGDSAGDSAGTCHQTKTSPTPTPTSTSTSTTTKSEANNGSSRADARGASGPTPPLEQQQPSGLQHSGEQQPKQKGRKRDPLPADDVWLASLKALPVYAGLNVDLELGKLDAWLLTPRGRGKLKSRGRIVNWLNNAATDQHAVAPQAAATGADNVVPMKTPSQIAQMRAARFS